MVPACASRSARSERCKSLSPSLEFIYVSDAVTDRRNTTVNLCNRFVNMFNQNPQQPPQNPPPQAPTPNRTNPPTPARTQPGTPRHDPHDMDEENR